MSRKLKFILAFIVLPPVLVLTVIGLGTVSFVARVGWQTAHEVAFEALKETIAQNKAQEAGEEAEAKDRARVEKSVASVPRTKTNPDAVQDYPAVAQSDVAEQCLSVADDPNRLLNCIREAMSEGDPQSNGEVEAVGRTLATRDLPLFDPAASAFQRIRDGETEIDYVDVRLTTRDPRDAKSVKISFQKLRGRRFLVLYGDTDIRWRLVGGRKIALDGILIVTDFKASDGRIEGVPEGVPVWRYSFPENTTLLLPHVAGIIPSCRQREGARVECTNGPQQVIPNKTSDDRSPFQEVDDWIHSTLGRRIDSFSRLSATRSGYLVVPMAIITQETRDALKRELARARLQMTEYRVKIQRRDEYRQRWRAERLAKATADLSERPPFDPAEAAKNSNEIVVVSLYETVTRRGSQGRGLEIFDSYAAFKADADEDARPVLVRVDVDDPIILILSAHVPVNWVLDVKDPELLKAVQIEGVKVPSFTGLPTSVPIRIINSALSEKALPFLHPKKPNINAALAEIQVDFGGLPVRLISNYRTDAVEVKD